MRSAMARIGVPVLLVLSVCVAPAGAQSLQDTLENLRNSRSGDTLQQQRMDQTGSNQQQLPVNNVSPNRTNPFDDQVRREPPSRVEKDYTRRLKNALPPDEADAARQRREMQSRQRDQDQANRPLVEDQRPVVEQFGYSSLRRNDGLPTPTTPVAGAVGGNYVLGSGDEIIVTLRGQSNSTVRARVDRDGRVVVPEMPPILAAGRTFDQFREDFERAASDVFRQTEVFLSVGNIRNIGVYVLGEVEQPGVQRLNGLASLLDAISAAGGVKKTGSLRDVKLVRGNRSMPVDLYEVLSTGHLKQELSLADGDKIVVPALSSTFGVVGEVRRPGIFELPPGKSTVTLREALALGGGPLRPDGYHYLRITQDSQGRDQAIEVSGRDGILRSGDILLLAAASGGEIGGFTLEGHVTVPGVRSLQAESRLSQVVANRAIFKDNPYLLFAVLQRTDDATLARHYVPVDLSRVLDNSTDLQLRQNDRLIILGAQDIQYLASADVQAVLRGRLPPSAVPPVLDPNDEPGEAMRRMVYAEVQGTPMPRFIGQFETTPARQKNTTGTNPSVSPDATQKEIPETRRKVCKSLINLAALVDRDGTSRFSTVLASDRQQTGTTKKDNVTLPNLQSCPEIYEQYPDLLPFVMDYISMLQGEVRNPGAYPILPGTKMSSVIAASGGLGRNADLAQIETTRFVDEREHVPGSMWRSTFDGRSGGMQQASLQPGDIIRVPRVYLSRDLSPVVLRGQVKRPGLYNIHAGEKLSEVIARAGGLADEAYPLGAVFTRLSVREQEMAARDKISSDMELGLASATIAMAQNQASRDSSAQMGQLSSMLSSLRNADVIGRVVVEADPTVLQVRPELDTVLQGGDELFIPKRPNHIAVMGQVLHPGAQQFREELEASSYIDMAGGMSQLADDSRTYVILPNGTARPLAISSWNYTRVQLPPGSTIVVPMDMRPFDTWSMTKDIMDIMSKVALSAASLAVISNN